MDIIWMPCTIENSGFPSERRFEVTLPEGGGKVVGVAYIEYLQHQDHTPIQDGEPPYNQTLDGFVQCRVIKRELDRVHIEFPGTDVFHVPQKALDEEGSNVSFRPRPSLGH